MNSLFESNLVQNQALGATAIWQFAAAYYKQRAKIEGPSLAATMVVLPMVFHDATVRAIADRPGLTVGLEPLLGLTP